MKYISKFLAAGCVALGMGLGMTSCIGDLDLVPEDPNQFTWADVEKDPDTYLPQVFAKCYSVLAVSGQSGEGSADLGGLDAGASCWSRALYMLNEFPTDETMWIWPDVGVVDLVTGSWSNGNANLYGTYSRLYVAIAICNDFIRQTNATGVDLTQSHRTAFDCTKQYQLEARAIRALNYYYVLDLFGNGGWVDDKMAYGESPTPIRRAELYDKLVTEVKSIISEWPAETAKGRYGRIGVDGVKALLAKLYLNAGVFTDGQVNGYADCLKICNEIIDAHKGGGFNGTGLANHYLAVFAGNNDRYMPGGSAAAENEILWGIPYEERNIQAYGGTRFLMAAAFINATMDSNGFYMNAQDYGLNDQWGCMHARQQFSEKFNDINDVRDDFWSKEAEGFTIANTEFSKFNNGYAAVKFTNLVSEEDGTFELKDPSKPLSISNLSLKAQRKSEVDGEIVSSATTHPDTDFPIFRLADIYLMKAECYVKGGQGNAQEALEAVNAVRERAGANPWTGAQLTPDNLLDERARELYWENHRRTDLVRFGKFVSGYNWAWKANAPEGADLQPYMNVYPIPANVIAAQPEFAEIQNPGY